MSSPESSNKRLSLSVSGPRLTPQEEGLGLSGHLSSGTVSVGGHSFTSTHFGFDVGASANKSGFRAFAAFDLLGWSYSNPSGSFKPSASLGVGGGVSVQNDSENRRLTVGVFPTRGKTGLEFSVSHDSLHKFADDYGRHLEETSSPYW